MCFGNNNFIWIIILIFLLGGSNGNGILGGTCANNGNDEGMWLIILILLLGCCGQNTNNCGTNNGCNMCEA